ncbi:uncharacterized protein [Dermacentor andersoni]|uniref:uncharacterized protein n=1 Tax=Dermacentor andersoni TaxID=34620 RepID=UPI0021554FC9|nr:uncharacterized protein LOC126537930 [Dermacentor andersoni]
MEQLAKYGDTWDLLLAEDHIVLKLAELWPPDVPLPEGCKLENSGSSLVTNQESLVAAKQVLQLRVRVSRALFAGCASFESSKPFCAAAGELLRDAEELCIAHNKDKVYKLIRTFPNVRVLALPHDLCRHTLENDEPTTDCSSPLVERSKLTQLLGNVESLGSAGLILSKETVMAVMRTCPRVQRIDSDSVLEVFLQLNGSPMRGAYCTSRNFTHLVLYAAVVGNGQQVATAGPDDVALAARTFPLVENVEVLVRSLEALDEMSAFRHVHSLAVALAPPIAYASAHSELQRLLQNWPRLEKLSLEFCGGVRLSAIARSCPRVRSLRFAFCRWHRADSPVDADAFPELESIEWGMRVSGAAFEALFSATCGRLRTLQVYDDESCCRFLHFCAREGPRTRFPRLEELLLATNLPVRAMGLEPECLHRVVGALPVLRHLATDSYDLRLFFENYCVPRDRLSLSWAACVLCAVDGKEIPSRGQAAALVANAVAINGQTCLLV